MSGGFFGDFQSTCDHTCIQRSLLLIWNFISRIKWVTALTLEFVQQFGARCCAFALPLSFGSQVLCMTAHQVPTNTKPATIRNTHVSFYREHIRRWTFYCKANSCLNCSCISASLQLEIFSRHFSLGDTLQHRAFNKRHICHPSLWRKYPARYISPSSSQNHTQLLRVLWTDPLRMWMRSVLYLRGVSSALRTCRASSTFPSSRYSRYFCCRSRNFIRCRGAKTKTRI